MASKSEPADESFTPTPMNESDNSRRKIADNETNDIDNSEVIYLPETPSHTPNLNVEHAYGNRNDEASREKTSVAKSALNDMFHKITNTVHNLFPWRKTILKNSVSPESGINTLNSLSSLPNSSSNSFSPTKSKRTDIQMDAFTTGQSAAVSKNSSSQSSQIFNHDFASNHTLPGANQGQRKPVDYLSYDSKIYSVNSAGNPVPITIENGGEEIEAEDSTSAGDSENNSEVRSEAPLQKPKSEPFDFKKQLRKIWHRTYHPDSMFIYCWSALVTLVFLYNVWLIPLRASFVIDLQTPYQTGWFVLDAFCDAIYIADIVIKFRTRVVKHGIYVTDVTALTRHHMRNWTLILDVISIFPTDFFFVITVNPYLRLNRVARVYRAYAFYRMVELKTWWPNALRLVNLLLMLTIIVHYNACIFYSSSLHNGFATTLTSWSFPNPLLFPDYASLTRKYTYSFYWSLKEISLIGGRPLPTADWEYVFAIYQNLMGLVTIGYTIGYLTMILLGKNFEKFEFEHSMESTRKYLKRRKLPKELRKRVEQFYEHTWSKSEFGHLDEDKMLRHLPLSIKEEIAYHGNYAALKELPEFAYCDSSILKSLVSKLTRRTYLPGQFIYKNGDPGTEMFIVGEGILQIIRERDGKILTARDGDIFGEMNLFDQRRMHVRTSDVISCGYSELYVLTAHDVNDVLSQYPQFRHVVLQEAKRKKALYRRKMSQNFYNRQLQYMTSTCSTESTKFLNSPSNVQLKMDRNQSGITGLSTFSDVTIKTLTGFNESPDSGMPTSPERPNKFEAESLSAAGSQNEFLDMNIPTEISKKLTALMEKNSRALNEVWLNEFMYLKQKLENTEAERDHKTKQILQMRHLMDNQKNQHSVRRRSSTTTIVENVSEEANVDSESETSKAKTQNYVRKAAQKWRSNVKARPGTTSKNKRTLFPTAAASKTSPNKTKKSVT